MADFNFSRRSLLQFASATLPLRWLGLPAAFFGMEKIASAGDGLPVRDTFPSQPPELVREIVTVAHFDLKRVKELVEARPSLAGAGWDWGFGDWETPLGAASHMGNRPIAEYLLSRGAHPTLFSATMLGQVDAVKGFLAANPNVQKTRGPHGISLLAHARMGGEAARPVFEMLKSLEESDMVSPAPLTDAETAKLTGTYVFGVGVTQQVEVTADPKIYGTKMYTQPPQLTWTHKGAVGRPLFHLGDRAFYPGGASAVRIRFAEENGEMVMTVTDADLAVTARKKKQAM
jgi:hypothetical protein